MTKAEAGTIWERRPEALVGFQLDVGAPELVSTKLNIGLLLLPAVPAKQSFAVVVAEPTAGKVPPSYISYFGALESAVEKVTRKTFRAVLPVPYPVALFGIATVVSLRGMQRIGVRRRALVLPLARYRSPMQTRLSWSIKRELLSSLAEIRTLIAPVGASTIVPVTHEPALTAALMTPPPT